MPIVVFHVTSDRLHDIEVVSGRKFQSLKDQLQLAGYDVADAEIDIMLPDETKVIGDIGEYKLKGNECIKFDTEDFSLPALEAKMQRDAADRDAWDKLTEAEDLSKYTADPYTKETTCTAKPGTNFKVVPCEDGVKIVFC